MIFPTMSRSPKIGVAAVIKNSQGKLLIVRRGHEPEKGRWALPGGHLEWGETLSQALRREVQEEVGLIICPERLLYVAELRLPDTHFVVLDFAASLNGQGLLHPHSDATEAQWMDLSTAGSVAWARGMEEFFQDMDVRAYLNI